MSLSILWKSIVGYFVGMEINPINSKIKVNSPQKSEETTSENFVAETVQEQDLPTANPSLLRAYTGVIANKDRQQSVSVEELLKYLEESNVPRKDKYPEIVSALTDKDGVISKEAFELFLNYRSKAVQPFNIVKLFKLAKEDEKLNYDALKAISLLIQNYKKRSYEFIYADVIKEMKDVDGKFDAEFLRLISQYPEQFSQLFEIRPTIISNVFKNQSGNFSKSTISYVSDEINKGMAFKDLLKTISKGQDKNRDFNPNLLNVLNEIEANYPQELSSIACGLIRMSEEDEYPQIFEFINLLKGRENVSKLFQFFEKMNIEKTQENLDFVEKVLKSINYNTENAQKLLEITNISSKDFDENCEKLIQSLNCIVYEPEDFELFLKASLKNNIKEDDSECKLDLHKLEKYLDIYCNNRGQGIEIVKKLSNDLALEENNRALDVFHQLFTISWKTKYGNDEHLSVGTLFFILELLCLEKDDKPTRKCYEERLDALEKLLTLEYPKISKENFENFLVFTEFDAIEKLEKLGFHKLGIEPGQFSKNLFKEATEEELINFKAFLENYLKDKNVKNVNVNLNENISTIVEITLQDYNEDVIPLFDLKKGKPLSEIKEMKYSNRVYKTQNDFVNNTVSELRYQLKKMGYDTYEVLDSQVFKVLDEAGNVLSEETIEKSEIDNVFNIKKTDSKGNEENLVKAFIDENGNKVVHKNLESFDGTKTIYHYEDDPQGNRILDYKIIDKKGKTLLNQSVSFEVLSDNHFVSTRNNKKFDMKIDGNNLIVTDLQTKEIITIELEEFTKSTQDKLMDILKQFPGDELISMKKINLKHFSIDNTVSNAAFRPDEKSILTSEKCAELSIILHELGHAKDELLFSEINEEIYSDPVLKDIYQQEKEAFRNHFGDEQLSFVGYFSSDKHYLGASKAIKEGIAETNSLLNTLPQNDIQAIRSHYWQQYFPRTIAYLSSLLI